MARNATIYRATLQISHVDRNLYGEQTLTIARHPSETMERTVMRLLAYALRYAEGLEFGRGISTADEPDLWRRAGDGRVIEWIEVGQPDRKRLIKASRQSQACLLFVFGDGAERWRQAQLETNEKLPDNLSIARISDAFVRDVAAACERQIRWDVTISDSMLFLSADDASFEVQPEIWLGDPIG